MGDRLVSLVGAALAVCALVGASVRAQRLPPPPLVAPEALRAMGASPCDPPFAGDHCPPPPGAPECRIAEHARSRDGRVTVELVEDGHRLASRPCTS